MPVSVENQRTFSAMTSLTQEARAQMEPKLHRHIESRHPARVDFNTREVVDSPIALADHRGNFRNPNFGAIGGIQRATGMIAGCGDGKSDRTQNRLEPVVERAIDEDRLRGWRLTP